MGKRKICKIVFVILSIFLCVVFYELFGICIVIIPELSEPPVRTLGATIPENESHIFR